MIGEALTTLMNTPSIWDRIGLPRGDFYQLIKKASDNRVKLEQMSQGDPIRLINSASGIAAELLDRNQKIAEIKGVVDELKEAEEAVDGKFYKPWSIADQIELRQVLKYRDLKRQTIFDYFKAFGFPIEDAQASYGFALGKLHTLEVEYLEPKCNLIREHLLLLKELLPAV